VVTLFACNVSAQHALAPDAIVHAAFHKPEIKKQSPRLLKFEKRVTRYNPLAYVGAGLLFVYQKIFSEQIQASCMYEVSCSEYTRLSVQRSGFIAGTLKGFSQLTECYAGAVYEHPPMFVSSHRKVINDRSGE
jgi:uncharacterized protein